MKISQTLDRAISQTLREANEKRDREHISSGKLSASMLGKPLQDQILKSIGVPQKQVDDYILRKFIRGIHCEEWVLTHFNGSLIEKQKFVEYRNVVGYADAIVDTKEWDFDVGVIPAEVKSVANAKYKRIEQAGSPDRSHLLQGALYALALQTKQFALIYIASDDYRIRVSIHDTEDFRGEIDEIISRYDVQMAKREIPAFVAIEKWQATPKYMAYPDFAALSGEAALAKARELGCKW